MQKITKLTFLILTLLIILNLAVSDSFALADWWYRSDVLPTQPSFQRELNLPTLAPLQPTSVVPSVAPTLTAPSIAPTSRPPIGGTTPSDPGENGSGSGGNACDPEKPYSGPYCGWSPSVGSGGDSSSNQPRIGGPQVLGLSDTSGSETAISDIILLAGVLCLALYARSKLNIESNTI